MGVSVVGSQTVLIDGIEERVGAAIQLLRDFEPPDGEYYLLYSGGKDSDCILQLAKEAGVRFRAYHNLTTIDPPEVVQHVKAHPEVTILRPERGFFAVALGSGFPTRKARWCCEYYKERRSPPGSVLVMGVRAEESARRAKLWSPVKANWRDGSRVICPIVYWTTNQVWEFLHDRHVPYCSLYDEGFERLGCIGCPMGRCQQRLAQFKRWPRYEKAWKRLFKVLWEKRSGNLQRDGRVWFGDRYFKSWEEMWEWWLNDEPLPGDECQGSVDMFS